MKRNKSESLPPSSLIMSETTDDYISDMPEGVIHRIMSFLPTKDVVKMSILSKKFKSTWDTYPVLDFDYAYSSQWRSYYGNNRFLNFMFDSIGRDRALNMSVHKFRLHFRSYRTVTADSRVTAAIRFAMAKKVQELDIGINPGSDNVPLYQLPSDIFRANSIRVLKLEGLNIDNVDLTKLPLMEELSFIHCSELQSIRVSSDMIKIVEIISCSGLSRVDIIDSPNLRSFSCYGLDDPNYDDPQPGQVNLISCKSIETLELVSNAYVTKNWVDDIVSKLKVLKKLRLEDCRMLTSMKIYLENLENFQLIKCEQLMEIELRAPKLTSFVYAGEVVQPGFIIDSPRLNARLTLLRALNPHRGWYKKLRDFIGYFDHCKSLALTLNREQSLIFSEDQRERLIPPLYDLKNLKVKFFEPVVDIVLLVDSLLWLAPLIETISIVTQYSEKVLELKYDKTVAMEWKDQLCCHRRLIKCWRHFAKIIVVKNFNSADESRLIREYFMNKAIRLECIVDDSD